MTAARPRSPTSALFCASIVLLASVARGGWLDELFDPRKPVAFLDVDAYMGLWHEIARTDHPANLRRNYGKYGRMWNTTDEYSWDENNGWVAMKKKWHRFHRKNPFDKLVGSYEGEGVVVPQSGNALWTNYWGGAFARTIARSLGWGEAYYVYAAGPVVDGKYQWSVVSNWRGSFVWVFSRKFKITLAQLDEIRRVCEEHRLPLDKAFWNGNGDGISGGQGNFLTTIETNLPTLPPIPFWPWVREHP